MIPAPLLRTYRFLALAAVALVVGRAAVPARADDTTTRTKQIADLEKQLAELNAKLAEMKKAPASPPRPLKVEDVVKWRSISSASLSNDGQWFAHRVAPGEGEGEVIVRQTKGDKQYKFPAGGGRFGGALSFSQDGKWLAFSVSPQSRPGSGPPSGGAGSGARRPSQKVVLVKLETGEKTEFEGVRRFAFSGEAANWIALQKTSADGPTPNPVLPAPFAPFAPPASTSSGGSDLVLRELATGTELTLGNVGEFGFDKKGQWLAMLIETKDQSANGVQLRNMATAALHQLDGGKATYESLVWTDKGDALSVLKGVEDKGYEGKLFSVLGFTDFNGKGLPQKVVYDPKADSSFPKGMTISANRAAVWTEDRSALTFGIQEVKAKTEPAAAKKDGEPKKGDGKKEPAKDAKVEGKKETAAPTPPTPGGGTTTGGAPREKPDLVIWHWSDDRLQSQQQIEAPFEKIRSELSIYHVKDKKFVRLADEKLRNVSMAPKQRWAIGTDSKPYQLTGSLDGRRFQDVYVIDAQTGTRRLALKQARWYFGVNPEGTHLLYYDNGHFFTQELATGNAHNITQSVPVSFVNTDDDHNVDKPPTSPMGWTKDGTAALLSDGWDVWQVPAQGGPGVNLTLDGRKEGIRYRSRISLDPEEKGYDPTKPAYVLMDGEWTKKSGIGRIDPGKPGVARLLWDDANVGTLLKAKNAEVFAYRRETVKDYPDFYVTADPALQGGKKVTDANPQQSQYAWSSGSMLVEYKCPTGDRLQAALFLPAGYEKGKKYPTVVYIYEKLSQGANRYLSPNANGFNAALYTSNGYAVLTPDIHYRINDPGVSSKECVLAALEAAAATGVVDKDRVGLQGHSWGGYQTAFLITQTDAFKAACAGAPLTNLVSMYSSIYWNTGSANQPIFESSQGRFTGGYWDNLEAYMRNSPVFHAKNVKTPLLLLHNDKDGAVDWNQGIEYFNTLRRLQKPVVMLQYKGENHGLAKSANQRDYTVRMKEFFDHHLTGKPAPAWLKEGVPHLKLDDHLKERSKQ